MASYWEHVADVVPDADAIVHGGRHVTWREVDDLAARLAASLQALGAGPGTKVALDLYNGVEYLVAQFAAFKLRAVPINVNYRYQADELVYLLTDAEVEVAVCDATLLAPLLQARPSLPRLRAIVAVGEPALDAEAGDAVAYDALLTAEPLARIERPGTDLYMLYTGGTTGMPKGVMYEHRGFVWQMLAQLLERYDVEGFEDYGAIPTLVRRVHADTQDRVVIAAPLMHGTGMWLGAMWSWLTGGAALTLPGASYDPGAVWDCVEAERATRIALVGDPMARPLLEELDRRMAASPPADFGSLREIVSAGAMWSAEVKTGLLRLADLLLSDQFGSTEGGLGRFESTRGTAGGTAVFHVYPQVRVVTEDGAEVGAGSGEVGYLATPAVSLGYWGDDTKTASTFRVIDSVRYVVSGDLGTVDEDGRAVLLGRGSTCINTGGEKVFPEEVEAVLNRQPGIVDSLVVGLPDARYGEAVHAVVAAAPGVDLDVDGVVAALRDVLSHYKVPRRVIVAPAVQRLASGKADYAWAKRYAAEHAGG